MSAETESPARDYSRLEPTVFHIGWMSSLSALVVGAGALGNEVIKNLALLGVSTLTIVDADVVELSNLTRSVLFSGPEAAIDVERRTPKATLAASRAHQLNPDVATRPIVAQIADVGLGIFRRADIVFSCLDNELARLETSWACCRTNKPLVDGGLGLMNYSAGQVSLFPGTDGPCYLCRKGTAKRRELLQEMTGREDPCWKKATDAQRAGIVVTTPLMASVIGALQVEIGLRHLRAAVAPAHGRAYRMTLHPGPTFDSGDFERSPTCPLHELPSVVRQCAQIAGSCATSTPRDLFAASGVNRPALRLDWPIVVEGTCGTCGSRWSPFMRIAAFRKATCLSCGVEAPVPTSVISSIDDESPLASASLQALGLPKGHIHEIVDGHDPDVSVHLELAADFDLAGALVC